jgi:hypothetical protein
LSLRCTALLLLVALNNLLKDLLPALDDALLLLDLPLHIVCDCGITLFDDVVLEEVLGLLQLAVPGLQLSEGALHIGGAHVTPVNRDDVELLVQLVQLPLKQLVINAVDY